VLVNWWVEKHQRFLFNVYKRFFLFLSRFLRFLTFFIFFLERFLHLCLKGFVASLNLPKLLAGKLSSGQ